MEIIKWLIGFLFLLITIICAGCKLVSSPINTTKQFFSLWQKEKYDEAFSFVVKSEPAGENQWKVYPLNEEEKKTLIENTKESSGKLLSYTVQNAVPIREEVLKKLQVNEGYEVYFKAETEKQGSQNAQYYLLKIDDVWKILPSINYKRIL